MTQQILTYWLIAQAFGLVGLPLAQTLLGALPDRGYAFAKPLGLLLTGYLAWLAAMLGLAPFGAPLIVGSALAVAVGGALAHGDARGIAPWLRERWRGLLGYEALFALALVFLAALRSYNPDPWGTERTMDFALFNAIRQSTIFPPQDPWMSGYSINYYYFGYLLMAATAMLSGLPPEVCYNLSLALIFALTALGVAGAVCNLIGLTGDQAAARQGDEAKLSGEPDVPPEAGRAEQAEPTAPTYERWLPEDDEAAVAVAPARAAVADERAAPDGEAAAEAGGAAQPAETEQARGSSAPPPFAARRSLIVTGLAASLTVVLVLFAGNQGAALQVISGTPMILALEGDDMWRALVNGAGPRETIALEPPFRGWDYDGTAAITPIDTLRDFNWWNPSRALWDSIPERDAEGRVTGVIRRYAITEFPFFSFWLGDMHPHVMALPFGLLALALALQTAARPDLPQYAQGRRGWLELLLSGVVLGSLYLTNSWDFPTYLLLFLGALLLLFARGPAERGDGEASGEPDEAGAGDTPTAPAAPPARPPARSIAWRAYAGQSALVVLAALALFLPFYLTFRSLVGGKEPLVDLPVLATITRTLGFVTWERTPLHTFAILFGLFLVPLIAYVAGVGQGEANDGPAPSRFTLWLTLITLGVGALLGFPLAALLPLAIYAGQAALANVQRPAAAFTLGAFALVCLICLGTEIVYIRDVFESRMNTIFKFYYQAWLIWGVLAGYAVWWLFLRRWATGDGRPAAGRSGSGHWLAVAGRGSIAGIFLLLLAGALVYPALTAGKTFREETPIGLAGKNPRQKTEAGAAAIEWLRANAPPDAVIVEAVEGAYDTSGMGFGGVSSTTGLAAVLGWPSHEEQWRGGDPARLAEIRPREADVTAIYSGALDVEQTRALLAKYGVDYIYVGAAELSKYPPEGLARLAELGDVVFAQGEVTIYAVRTP